MTAINEAEVPAIIACRGVYTAADTARHFGLAHMQVARIWRRDDTELDLPEPPNIWGTRTTDDLILADAQILLDRGLTLAATAAHLGTSTMTLMRAHHRAGRRYHVRHDNGWKRTA